MSTPHALQGDISLMTLMRMLRAKLLALLVVLLVESIAHFMFECPVTASARTHMYDIIKTSVNGELKLQKCLSLSCGRTMVAKFVSCEFWNDKRAIVHNAIAMFLQKAWRIRNAYKHGILLTLMLLMVLYPPP